MVGVDIEQYDAKFPGKYFRGLLKKGVDPYVEKAFQSYISVKPSSTDMRHYIEFSRAVNYYLEKPPFNFSKFNFYGLKLEVSLKFIFHFIEFLQF